MEKAHRGSLEAQYFTALTTAGELLRTYGGLHVHLRGDATAYALAEPVCRRAAEDAAPAADPTAGPADARPGVQLDGLMAAGAVVTAAAGDFGWLGRPPRLRPGIGLFSRCDFVALWAYCQPVFYL
ncbi:MAG: hypothetical protein LBH76_07295 [Propionibacteriaceae bacterium]|nr:hypothetical protein [Propionibacteriaceae bacterium]